VIGASLTVCSTLTTLALVTAACGGRAPNSPPSSTMHPSDDLAVPPTPYTLELTVTADDAAIGRVVLAVKHRGHDPVTLVLPEQPEEVEWFEPDARQLADPTLRVMWTAWRLDNGSVVDEGRHGTLPRHMRRVTLGPGEAAKASFDLGPSVDVLLLPRGPRPAWCARAWLVGGTHPLPSNVVCWPESPAP
jgi:hypothetical protein